MLESSPGSYLEILITLSFWTLWEAPPTQLQIILEQPHKQQQQQLKPKLPLLKQQPPLLKLQLQLLKQQPQLLKQPPHNQLKQLHKLHPMVEDK
jgi:hypothetical protein